MLTIHPLCSVTAIWRATCDRVPPRPETALENLQFHSRETRRWWVSGFAGGVWRSFGGDDGRNRRWKERLEEPGSRLIRRGVYVKGAHRANVTRQTVGGDGRGIKGDSCRCKSNWRKG